MAGIALSVVTLIACSLLLLLFHLELRSAAPLRLDPEPDFNDEAPAPSPPPPQQQYVQPVCQVTFGRSVCERGGIKVECPAKVDQVRHDTKVTHSGAWELTPTYTCTLMPATAAMRTCRQGLASLNLSARRFLQCSSACGSLLSHIRFVSSDCMNVAIQIFSIVAS